MAGSFRRLDASESAGGRFLREADYYQALPDERAVRCKLCPHYCRVAENGNGICLARVNRGGKLVSQTYGRVTSVANDPVEKKPLYHFRPGATVLSIGSWGCNLKCAFCQNWQIAQQEAKTRELSPSELVMMAKDSGAAGVAYTYNEPYINYEFVRDCARAVKGAGLKNVLVSNGYCNPEPLAQLLPRLDALNIDLKGFSETFYKEQCGGSIAPVLQTIRTAAAAAHVEVTTLLIPGLNDDPAELDAMAAWLAANCGADLPAHLSAYFPCHRCDRPATERADLEQARAIFRRHLRHVYVGNIAGGDWQDSHCAVCGAVLVKREQYRTTLTGLNARGLCAACGAANRFVV